MGTVNDITKATFHGRVRKAPSSSVMYNNEVSARFPSGTYFWVTDNFEIWDKLARPVLSGTVTTQYKDYDFAYEQPKPRVWGLQTGYAGNINPSSGKLRIALSVSAKVEAFSGTISSYLWSFRSGIATVISGSLSTATVTVDIDPTACPTWGETWGTLTVTDSNGTALVRKFGIKAHDSSHLPNIHTDPIDLHAHVDRGYTADVPFFYGVDSVLPGAMGIVWRADETYGTTAGLLGATPNIDFIGWFTKEDPQAQGDFNYGITSSAKFHLEDVLTRLSYFEIEGLAIINSNGTLWDDISLCEPRVATWHLLTWHSTAGSLCDFTVGDDLDNEQYIQLDIGVQMGNILNGINVMAAQINAQLEVAPWGALHLPRAVGYLSQTQRDALTTVGAFNSSDGEVVSVSRNYNNAVGFVDMLGITLNGVPNAIALRSVAPGLAQGPAQGRDRQPQQILASQSTNVGLAQVELNQRAGNRYEILNLQEAMTVRHPDGYNFPIPSRAQLYTWTLDTTLAGTNGVNRIVYDTSVKWYVESVNTKHDSAKGKRQVEVVYRRVTRIGDAGDIPPTIPNTGNTLPPVVPPALPFDPLPSWPDTGWGSLPVGATNPPPGKITFLDGRTVVIWSATQAWITTTFALANPIWSSITPPDLGNFLIKQVLFDPLGPPNNTCGAYLLASDGTNSAVRYTTNALQHPPVWSKGANIAGTFSVLRGTGTSGTILIYGSGTDVQTLHSYDFTTGQHGFTNEPENTTPSYLGIWTSGSGWKSSYAFNYIDSSQNQAADIAISFSSPIIVTDAQFAYDLTQGAYDPASFGVRNGVNLYLSGSHVANNTVLASSDTNGTNKVSDLSGGPWTCDHIRFSAWSSLIKSASITYASPSGDASAVKSTDFGATWGGAQDIGASLGAVGGFDVQRSGGNSFAASDGKVRRATSLGGAYSDYYAVTGGVQAACVIVPYFNWAGTRQTNATNPDVVVGLTAPDSSSRTLLWIEGGASPGTVHDLTPVASFDFENANAITLAYQHHIAVFGNVSGTRKLYTTNDKAATWVNRGTLVNPKFLRGRRNDSSAAVSGTNLGQLYAITNDQVTYDKTWGNTTMYGRTMPGSGILGFDIWN
jgi:hypothetical protein